MVPQFVSTEIWIITIAAIVGLLAFDYFFHARKAHIPSLKEAAIWSAIYVGLAILFGIMLWIFTDGHRLGMEYFAGYITEKALSVDNLFVFLIIISSFKVPRADQQKVLLFGITFSLIMRTGLILVGAAMINRFAWVFYIFGIILLITAGHLLLGTDDDEEETADNMIIRFAKKHLHTTNFYDGDKMFTMVDGKKALTPMLLVMVAIGGTDILFALDSIPAIFGLTQEPYIVFTATAFSLMGLRQLYFLIDGLLDRLIYLSYGLAAILGFIGVKLILHALHENNLPFINNGEGVHVYDITTGQSLIFIIATLTITVMLSLFTPSGKAKTAMKNAKRHLKHYLALDFETYPNSRAEAYRKLVHEEQVILAFPDRFRHLVFEDRKFLEDIEEARRTHDEYIAAHRHIFPDGYLDDMPVIKMEDYPPAHLQTMRSRPPWAKDQG